MKWYAFIWFLSPEACDQFVAGNLPATDHEIQCVLRVETSAPATSLRPVARPWKDGEK